MSKSDENIGVTAVWIKGEMHEVAGGARVAVRADD